MAQFEYEVIPGSYPQGRYGVARITTPRSKPHLRYEYVGWAEECMWVAYHEDELWPCCGETMRRAYMGISHKRRKPAKGEIEDLRYREERGMLDIGGEEALHEWTRKLWRHKWQPEIGKD